ncbi:MAG: GTP-binding protein [Methanobacterium sp. ERen5]|nr:MAG: GTP-binding protein [Methanobacterium sp. ERen5]
MKKTHIPKLDDFLGGGVPKGSSLLFSAVPGVECEAFGYQILNGFMEDGNKGFIFTNVAEPSNITYEFSRYGWDLETRIKQGEAFFIDGASSFIGMPPDGKYIINNHEDVYEMVKKAIKDVEDGVGIINNLSTLIDYNDPDEIIPLIKGWNEEASKRGTVLVYLFTEWDYKPDLIESIRECFDCVVSLNSIEERVIIGQGFMVTSASWTKPQTHMVLFFIMQPGGVKIYIPKILVTGPYNAGKSSFVKAISQKSVSVDRMALEKFPTTIAMDIGHLDHGGFVADIFGTPGQERFDLMLDILAKEAVGAFILIDSSAPQTFARAKEMINKTHSEAIPNIIVANKQDLEGALSPEQIRQKMNLNDKIPILPTVVTAKTDVKQALDTLLKHLYG